MNTKITVETRIKAPIEKIWAAWTQPDHIVQWNAASDDWHSPRAENDLRVGGRFNYRMEARDKSMGFDFEGKYTEIIPHRKIAYSMDDDRDVVIEFMNEGDYCKVSETFVAEETHPLDVQRAGWQSILDNFRRHVESIK